MKRSINLLVAFTVITLGFIACSENNTDNSKTGTVHIRMTDTMADYLAVNVDIQSITIHFEESDSLEDMKEDTDSVDTETKSWVTIPTQAGIYNLLEFQNGNDTLIASGEIPVGKITQLRLLLGENNNIITAANDTFSLKVPSGSNSGYKILVNKEITEGENLVLLFDFNAEKSVVKQGNGGKYLLKPVLKLIEEED